MCWAHLHTLLGDYICLLGSSNESNIHKLEKWPCAFHSYVCIKIKYVRCSSLCKRPAFDIWLRGFLVIFLCIGADLGLRPRARTTHPPPRTPAPPPPFCDVLYYIWRILSKIKSIHIAGSCPGHPFLNFWIRSWFYLVFFLCRSLLAITRQWNRENFAISSVKLRSDV